MKSISIARALTVSALLSAASLTSHAAEFAVFIKSEGTPKWSTIAISGFGSDRYRFTADLITPTYLQFTLQQFAGSTNGIPCPILHLQVIEGTEQDQDIDDPLTNGGNCTYEFDIDKNNVVGPGFSKLWTTIPEGVDDYTLDKRTVAIRELSSVTIVNDTGGNNSTVDQSSLIDSAIFELVQPAANITGMSVQVLESSGTTWYWQQEIQGSAATGFEIKMPYGAICNAVGAVNRYRRILVNEIVETEFSRSVSTASTYDANCSRL